MEYKGQQIDDTRDVIRYEKLDKFTNKGTNNIELGVDELDKLKEIIRKKETELNKKGVRYSNVKILMSAIDKWYNDPAEFNTSLSWMEEENESEREERIQFEKERIDMDIADEERIERIRQRIRREMLAAAVKTIEENGGTVENLNI